MAKLISSIRRTSWNGSLLLKTNYFKHIMYQILLVPAHLTGNSKKLQMEKGKEEKARKGQKMK